MKSSRLLAAILLATMLAGCSSDDDPIENIINSSTVDTSTIYLYEQDVLSKDMITEALSNGSNTLKIVGTMSNSDFSPLLSYLCSNENANIKLDLSETDLTSIPDYAFYSYGTTTGAGGLTEIILPATVTTIGNLAFCKCWNLISVIGTGISTISYAAFRECSSLTTVEFEDLAIIGEYAFQECSSLTNAEFEKVTTISAYAFLDCSSLTTAKFKNATAIGERAFEKCSNLTTIEFENVTFIDDFAFLDCSSLTNAEFEKVTTIGIFAFYRCSNLTNAVFEKATTISYCAFAYCSSLTNVEFENATTIDGGAFESCSSLTNAEFKNVTTIREWAFLACENLTAVKFEKATTIGAYAFEDCSNLKTAKLGGIITSIGNSVFINCISLTELYLTGCESAPSLAESQNAFTNVTTANITVYVKDEAVQSAFQLSEWVTEYGFSSDNILVYLGE